MMEWTDESIARLRDLWAEGHSTAEIGRRMQITKNAVVGKAHRLTLSPRPSPIRKGLELASTGLQSQASVLPREAAPIGRPSAPRLVALPDAVAHTEPPTVHAPSAPAQTVVAPPAVAATAAKPFLPAREPAEAASVDPSPFGSPPVGSSPAESARIDNVRPLRPLQSRAPDPQASTEEPDDVVDAQPASRPVAAQPRRRGLSCCWPLGEPGTKGFHFCGAEPAPGKPYCAEHVSLAYVKLRDRRDSVA